MRIRELFTIPEGQKATEKAFCRVLISTICWTVTCMVCLAGTTWAWFTVDIENQGNEIVVASATAQVNINNQLVGDTYQLEPDATYHVEVGLTHSGTDWKTPVYVLMYKDTDCCYFTFTSSDPGAQLVSLPSGEGGSVSFQVSWIAPVGAVPIEEYLADTAIVEPPETTVAVEEDMTSTTAPSEDVPPSTTVPQESEDPQEPPAEE